MCDVSRYLRDYVVEWFKSKFEEFTPPQLMAIPKIKEGRNVLISSPTGTGKTLAVFLPIIDELLGEAESGLLRDYVYVVYVSPLRALNNDMRKNLIQPVLEIREYALKTRNLNIPEIRIGVRTSDTSPTEKAKMLVKPPHILITTPESLAISITAPKFREKLRNVRWVVVDEIHELASSKRGALLTLTIERLEELVGRRIQRIGLSATISPLEEVAKFLVGYEDLGNPRDCVVIDARFVKHVDLRVVTPRVNIVTAGAEELNESIYKELRKIINSHRTTLIFTNTRSSTERVVHKLKKILAGNSVEDLDEIEAHHSSLSRDVRLEVENKLKEGKLRVVVSSTSLELGIDIGYIDAVVLLSSPKSVTRLLQRVGRSGHNVRDMSKGYLVAVDRDDLVEISVLTHLARLRKLDNVHIPMKPLDMLAQVLVGMSLERKWRVEDAYRVVKRAYNYSRLTYEEFLNVLKYLAGEYGDIPDDIPVYSKIWLDKEEGVFGRKKSVRMIYYLNAGAIPDETKMRVFLDGRKYIGDLEEEFVSFLEPGDVFVLGGRTYMFVRSEGLKVIVKDAEKQRPTVPSWFSEALPLTYDSALEVGAFRGLVSDLISKYGVRRATKLISSMYQLGERESKYITQYVWEQIKVCGIVPTNKKLLVELWNEENTQNVIFHFLFGRRVNQVLSRAYAHIFSNELGVPVRVTISDNGFILTLPSYTITDISSVKKLVSMLSSVKLRETLIKALRRSEILKRKFRHVAERSLALLKVYRGVETSINRREINSETLLKISEKIPGYPLLVEAYREVMEDSMDLQHAEEVLKKIESGEISIEFITSPEVPCPFSHNLIVQGYSDVVLMEDRRKILSILYNKVLDKMRSENKSKS
ncbi:MAG: ATP-dependent helicase [Desulfurococcaceae archaeon TW002]